MSSSELPPLPDRARTLSGSSEFNSKKARKQSESSLLELASRSPHSFNSNNSSNNSISGGNSVSRFPRTGSWNTSDHLGSKKLDTLFEQKRIVNSSMKFRSDSVLSKTQTSHQNINSNKIANNEKETFKKNKSVNSITNAVTNGRKPVLKRINSESKISLERKNSKNMIGNDATKRLLSIDKTEALTNSPFINGHSKGKRNSFDSNGNRRMSISNRRNSLQSDTNKVTFHLGSSDDDHLDDDLCDPEDEELNERVRQWLEEVEREAETPPEPNFIYEDVPPQTDSAIHIVYGES